MRINVKVSKLDTKALARQVKAQAGQDLKRRLQVIAVRYKGQPIEEIKEVLRADCRQHGVSISESGLSSWATSIHDGTPISATVKWARVTSDS